MTDTVTALRAKRKGFVAIFHGVSTKPLGRPPATSHSAIEETAFALFDQHGFETTTMDDIAAEVGIGRRTLFRYYPSKNDILWGQFDDSLRYFEDRLAAVPDIVSITQAIRDSVIDFNTFPADVLTHHRRRMQLLLGTPQLLAHSELRYAAWRDVIARFVARRSQVPANALAPTIAGRVTLALAISAYELWLADEASSLTDLIAECFDQCSTLFAPPLQSPLSGSEIRRG